MHLTDALPTLMSTGVQLSVMGGDFFEDVTLYRSTVVALQYLTIIRPNIVYSVNCVCQFMQTPLLTNWKAVKHILRYLSGILDYGIPINDSCLSLHGYCDDDLGQ